MLPVHNMIMIGACGRNTGKTEMACRLIKKFTPDYTVIALKVTTIKKPDGKYTPGNEDHGLSSGSPYLLTEEHRENPEKDTGKMLAAGAHKVYWLKVKKEYLTKGMETFLELINNGPDKIIICESNSLRLVVEPGLFLINQNIRDQSIKPSCQDVISFQDHIIQFDREKFVFDVDAGDINYVDGNWYIKESATAIILAGGKSSRMGQDKSLLFANNLPLIGKIASQLENHFQEIIIGANDIEKYRFLHLPVIPDLEEGKGPLMGIYSTLLSSKHEINFVIACDIPDLNIKYVKELIRQAKDHQIVVPTWNDGKFEPLFAVYRKSILNNVKNMLDTGQRKIRLLFESADVKYLPMPDEGKWYRNLNTMEDYENYIKQ
ncbi:MAG: molybdenum cofactor guanylyltransferase [Smithellaceae bacterium]